MTSRVLVLGATGFIGGHVAHAAIAKGWEVHGLRRDPGRSGRLPPAPIVWHQGDLDQPDSLAEAFDGKEIVFHTAGYYPSNNRNIPEQVNFAVEQTRHVLEAAEAAEVKKLVYTSSLTTIGLPPGDSDRLADERDVYQPGQVRGSAYYECKIAMEREVLKWAKAGHQAVVLNPTVVIGPGDRPNGLSQIVVAVKRGWARVCLPVTINVIDVRDTAQAHVAAAQAGRPGQRYILGAENFSMRDYLLLAANTLDAPPPRLEIPLGLVEGIMRLVGWLPPLASAAGHVYGLRHWQGYDTSRAREDLDLDTRAPEETLRDTLAWILEP
jgi:dihydroflavonol-4-reductase